AVYTTTSSGRVLPGSRPSTFSDPEWEIRLLNASAARASSAVGVKPGRSALFFSASKSWPAFANRRCAASVESQPAAASLGSGSSAVGSAYCGPDQLLMTTSHG